MQKRLSSRLATVANYVLEGRPMADVGTDHAQLPLSLLRDGLVPKAVALDVASGPLRIAKQASQGMEARIAVRRSDGLQALDRHEVSTICMCGMGGKTMADILRRGRGVWTTAERLVLQPQGMEYAVRMVMVEAGWDCVDGALVKDRGKLFVVEAWQPVAEVANWSKLDFRWGRRIRTLPDPLFCERLMCELERVDLALRRMKEANALGRPDAIDAEDERATIPGELRRLDHQFPSG